MNAEHTPIRILSVDDHLDLAPSDILLSAIPDMLAGNISGAMTEINTGLPHHKAGKVRIVAVASAARSPQASDVPTVIESGIPDYDVSSWNGISAPAGTPLEIVNLLSTAIIEALKSPDVQQKAKQFGMEARGSTPEELTARNKRLTVTLIHGLTSHAPRSTSTGSADGPGVRPTECPLSLAFVFDFDFGGVVYGPSGLGPPQALP